MVWIYSWIGIQSDVPVLLFDVCYHAPSVGFFTNQHELGLHHRETIWSIEKISQSNTNIWLNLRLFALLIRSQKSYLIFHT